MNFTATITNKLHRFNCLNYETVYPFAIKMYFEIDFRTPPSGNGTNEEKFDVCKVCGAKFDDKNEMIRHLYDAHIHL